MPSSSVSSARLVRSGGARAALAAAVVVPLVVAAAPTASAATPTQLEQSVVALVNRERAKVRCSALRVDARLAKAAKLHSTDMAVHNYFSHTSRDGRTPWTRIRAQGYRYGSAENIAAGQTTASEVVAAWMHSPGHRKNILNCSNKAIGVGVARVLKASRYGVYWTQDFGRR
ncbi:CAP domain-containing protein [Phycicoccus sp.]|uniref:CAP domain-containing protein n=1 Tax=Phycicoccus sp. TaxID=1902410 RepID=UPI002B8AAEB0|nr:CAP domain-containing protein [Phycicoccus sp.]HMM96945.1 CAP domain-containing protein [Phycicoccus sp.]